jgi:DNA invertase Pin-like site-specific DNA recombinase
MPLAWSYARTSTTRQAQADRSGLDRQEEALTRWLADHPDYRLQEALVDAGVSAGKGRNRKRGALAVFIEGGRTGAVPPGSCLVVESMSRFSREIATTTLRTLLNDVWGAGLAISFCTDGVVLDEELIAREDHRLHAVLGAIGQARREWEERSRRAKGAVIKRSRLQDEGATPPSRRPWWIDRAGDGWVLNPACTAIVRRIVQLGIEGLGRTRIAQVLAEEGILTARGGAWSPGSVLKLLRHPALVGTLRRQDRDLAGFYPPVISQAEHQALEAVMAANLLKHGTGANTTLCRNLFQGLSRCAHCGGPISYVKPNRLSRKGHPGFVWCRHAAERKQCPGGTATVLADAWEAHCLTRLSAAVWEELLGDPGGAERLAQVRAAARDAEAAAAQTEERLRRLQHKLGTLWEQGAEQELQDAATLQVRAAQGAQQSAQDRLREAAMALSAEEGKLTSSDAGEALQAGVAGFMQGAATASGAERLRFNRWLNSRQPTIRFLLDAAGQRVAMCVGSSGAVNWGLPVWMPLGGPLAAVALAAGGVGVAYAEGEPGEMTRLLAAIAEKAGLAPGEVAQFNMPDGQTVLLEAATDL